MYIGTYTRQLYHPPRTGDLTGACDPRYTYTVRTGRVRSIVSRLCGCGLGLLHQKNLKIKRVHVQMRILLRRTMTAVDTAQ